SASGPFYVRYETPEVTRAVDLVVAAGGVPVVAHVRASARGRIITDEKIADLVDHGLAAIEVGHRDHTEAARANPCGLGAGLGVLLTGSSDYPGAGKPTRLGENTTDPGVLAEIEERGALDVIRT